MSSDQQAIHWAEKFRSATRSDAGALYRLAEEIRDAVTQKPTNTLTAQVVAGALVELIESYEAREQKFRDQAARFAVVESTRRLEAALAEAAKAERLRLERRG